PAPPARRMELGPEKRRSRLRVRRHRSSVTDACQRPQLRASARSPGSTLDSVPSNTCSLAALVCSWATRLARNPRESLGTSAASRPRWWMSGQLTTIDRRAATWGGIAVLVALAVAVLGSGDLRWFDAGLVGYRVGHLFP